MSAKPSESRKLANTVSELCYGIAGWLMIGFGMLGIIVQIGYLAPGEPPADSVVTPAIILLSIVMILFGVFVNPRFRRRMDRRHSLTQFGRVRNVNERVLHAAENQTKRCVECGSRLNEGLARRYREEICFAGIPVFTNSENHNHYCVECATTELGVSARDNGVGAEVSDGPERELHRATERR